MTDHGAASAARALVADLLAPGRDVPDDKRRLVRRAFDAWVAGTGSPFDLLAEDARWTIEGDSLASRTYPGREAFLAGVIHP